jgi:hypothetical protein
VAAIPDAGGARYAPRGVMHALLRVVVLAGLVIAGWLLGSGIGHADEDLGQPGTGVVQLGSDPRDSAAPSDGGSGSQLGVSPMPAVQPAAVSILKGALPDASVPRLPVHPVDVLKPVVRAVDVPKTLTHVLAPMSRPMSGPARHDSGIRPQAPADKPMPVPPDKPVSAAPAPAPALGAATVRSTVDHALPTAPVCAAAAPVADPFAGGRALGEDPVAPVPASPPDSTTAPCMIGSAGSGAGNKGAPDVTVNESSATAGLAHTHRLLYLSASDLPRSPAEQPSTSPD